jgi:hypothetical protein
MRLINILTKTLTCNDKVDYILKINMNTYLLFFVWGGLTDSTIFYLYSDQLSSTLKYITLNFF